MQFRRDSACCELACHEPLSRTAVSEIAERGPRVSADPCRSAARRARTMRVASRRSFLTGSAGGSENLFRSNQSVVEGQTSGCSDHLLKWQLCHFSQTANFLNRLSGKPPWPGWSRRSGQAAPVPRTGRSIANARNSCCAERRVETAATTTAGSFRAETQ